MFDATMTFRDAVTTMSHSRMATWMRSRYAEPWRAYHDERHLSEIKDHLLAAEDDGVRIVDGAAALAFVLWHDCVYDPQAPHRRNETLSAQLCSSEFGAIGHPISVMRACESILATIGHAAPDAAASPDAALLLDCDLAILGAEPVRFAEYDAQIRTEYAHVPIGDYRRARADVLERFLGRDRLYLTDWAFDRWEGAARRNLADAITRLRS